MAKDDQYWGMSTYCVAHLNRLRKTIWKLYDVQLPTPMNEHSVWIAYSKQLIPSPGILFTRDCGRFSIGSMKVKIFLSALSNQCLQGEIWSPLCLAAIQFSANDDSILRSGHGFDEPPGNMFRNPLWKYLACPADLQVIAVVSELVENMWNWMWYPIWFTLAQNDPPNGWQDAKVLCLECADLAEMSLWNAPLRV